MLSVAAIAVSTGLLLGTCGSTTEPATTVPGKQSEPQPTTTTRSGNDDYHDPVASGRRAGGDTGSAHA